MTQYDNDWSQQGALQGNRRDDPKAAVQAASGRAKDAVDEAAGAVSEAASTAREAVSTLAGEAQDIAAEAGEKARSFVDANKGRAAEQISGIGAAIGKAADELENRGQGQLARYVRDLAGNLDGASKGLNEKGVDDLMGSIGSFARSQPAAFLGAAALLGFVSSRFAMSTAKPAGADPSAVRMARGADGSADFPEPSANVPRGDGAAYAGGN